MTMKQVPSVLPAGTADDATGATVAADGAARRTLGATAAREAALVLAGAVAIALIGQIRLPLPFTPVPVTLGTLAVLGAGGLLGARRALASVALYAAAAALGAPVLAGWHSGMTASFGYVLGYGLAAVVAGAATAPRPASARGGAAAAVLRRAGLMLLASAVVHVPGLIWLKAATGAAWGATLTMGLAPFVVGDLPQSAVAALLPARRARGCAGRAGGPALAPSEARSHRRTGTAARLPPDSAVLVAPRLAAAKNDPPGAPFPVPHPRRGPAEPSGGSPRTARRAPAADRTADADADAGLGEPRRYPIEL